MAVMVLFPNTFSGPNTQNLTFTLTNLTSTAVGYIPKYGRAQMHVLNRVPIPRMDDKGNWLYMQLRYRWAFVRAGRFDMWGPSNEPHFLAAGRVPWWLGGKAWEGAEYSSHDEVLLAGGPLADAGADSEAGAPHDGKAGDAELLGEAEAKWRAAGWTVEEARLAASEGYQAELRRDRKAKLQCFGAPPSFRSLFGYSRSGRTPARA